MVGQPRKREKQRERALDEARLGEGSRGTGMKSVLVCDGKRPHCSLIVWRVPRHVASDTEYSTLFLFSSLHKTVEKRGGTSGMRDVEWLPYVGKIKLY